MSELIQAFSKPKNIRSANGADFTALSVTHFVRGEAAVPVVIAAGSSRQKGFVEYLDCELRDELKNGEWFCMLAEATMPVEAQMRIYNQRSVQCCVTLAAQALIFVSEIRRTHETPMR